MAKKRRRPTKARRPLDPDTPIGRDIAAMVARLVQGREFRGVTARELSTLAGVSPATVSSVEGGRGITLATAFRLADALRVRRAWLIAGDGSPEKQEGHDHG